MTATSPIARAAIAGLLLLGAVLDATAQPAAAAPPPAGLSLAVLGSGGPGMTGRAGSSCLVFGPDGRKGTGDEASFPSTRRFVDLLFGADGAFGYLRDFSAPMTIQATSWSAPSPATTAMRRP